MSTLPHIQYDDLELYEKCGSGMYGSVFRAFWRKEKRIVAVKKMLFLEEEADILSLISHRNIVRFYGVVLSQTHQWIVMEFAPLGSLFDFLRKDKSQIATQLAETNFPILHSEESFQQILRWGKEIALGMNYLHCEAPDKVIHRDLKSKNVVITAQLVCKICDFGSSRFAGSTTKMSLAGTYPWMAPEVIECRAVNEKCDLWSYGVVLWEIITKEIPFDGLTGFQVQWAVVEKKERLTIPKSCPVRFANLMKTCWLTAPNQRPSFKYIIEQLEGMLNDEMLAADTEKFLLNKSEWSHEIEDAVNLLKLTKLNLGIKEKELKQREYQLSVRERNLEKSFKVVQPNLFNVMTWREVDVAQWILSLDSSMAVQGEAESGLSNYASLFSQNNITGRLLLDMSEQDIRRLGITSHGHISELVTRISKLRESNQKNLHYPPLGRMQSKPQITGQPDKKTKEVFKTSHYVILTVGIHSKPAANPQEIKWMPYLLFDTVDIPVTPDPTNNPAPPNFNHPSDQFDECMDVKDVTFRMGGQSFVSIYLDQAPFTSKKWSVGLQPNSTLHTTISFNNTRVVSPKTEHIDLILDQTSNTIERKVKITLQQIVSNAGSTCDSVDSVSSSASSNWMFRENYNSTNKAPSPDKYSEVVHKPIVKSWASIVSAHPTSKHEIIVPSTAHQSHRGVNSVKRVPSKPIIGKPAPRPTVTIPSHQHQLSVSNNSITRSKTSSPIGPFQRHSDPTIPNSARYNSDLRRQLSGQASHNNQARISSGYRSGGNSASSHNSTGSYTPPSGGSSNSNSYRAQGYQTNHPHGWKNGPSHGRGRGGFVSVNRARSSSNASSSSTHSNRSGPENRSSRL